MYKEGINDNPILLKFILRLNRHFIIDPSTDTHSYTIMAPHAEESTTTTATKNMVPIPVNPAKLAATLTDKTRGILFPLKLDAEAELEGKKGQTPAKYAYYLLIWDPEEKYPPFKSYKY